MSRVKTFVNGGSLLPGDLNSIQDDYENAFSSYKDLVQRGGVSGSTSAGSVYMLADPGSGVIGTPGSTTKDPSVEAFYLDPADRSAGTRTVKYRLRAQCVTNAVAPGITFTFGLYPVASYTGASGAQPLINTLGTVVAGSTVAIATPGAGASTQSNSGDFLAPAAGFYVVGFTVSGPNAAGSIQSLLTTLQARQV